MEDSRLNGYDKLSCPFAIKPHEVPEMVTLLKTLHTNSEKHISVIQQLDTTIQTLQDSLIAPATNQGKVDIEFVRLNNKAYLVLIAGLLIICAFFATRISSLEANITPTSFQTKFKSNEDIRPNQQSGTGLSVESKASGGSNSPRE